MKRAFSDGLMPLEAAFTERLPPIYRRMKQRFGARRFKTGKRKGQVFRPEIPLPFTLEQFLAWIEKQLGSMSGMVKCAYCAAMLDARNVAFDHIHPVQQGGSVGLDNIACCCQSCNREKGPLTLKAFLFLRALLKDEVGKHLTVADAANISMRLKSGGGFYKAKASNKKLEQPATVQDTF
jgi:5-methylcytosine-specific restriction endonuclease McrA